MLDPEHPSGHRPVRGSDDGLSPEVTRFVSDVEAALRVPQAARRLSLAGVRAQIDVVDAGVSLTLALERHPPSISVGTSKERPTVRLSLPAAELQAMLEQGSHLPMAIIAGDVVFEGSVRKLLRVLPILRSAVVESSWHPREE